MPGDFPPGWNKTITDLCAEADKLGLPVGSPQTDWARAYERSLLRPWARFPLDGDIYEALEDTAVSFMTSWKAPFTGGGTGAVPKGTKVRVSVSDFEPEPIRVYAQPLEREMIERLLVPEEDRKSASTVGLASQSPLEISTNSFAWSKVSRNEPSNHRLERAVKRLWLCAACALRYVALASQWTRRRAAAQPHR
jgi:hypothetical protein